MSDPAAPPAAPPAPPGSRLARWPRAAWRGLLLFLEIIGLYRSRACDQAARLARFRLNHTEFRKLLSANDSFLSTLTALEGALQGRSAFDLAFVRRHLVRALADIHRMVASLDQISERRYANLEGAFTRLAGQLTEAAGGELSTGGEELVLDLEALTGAHADLVGGKMANLGEVRNVVGLPTPDGFAVTTAGFHALLRGASSVAGRGAQAPAIADELMASPVPVEVERAMLAAHRRLAARVKQPDPRVAVRSSALGEDTAASFAGQFLTVLNVGRLGLVDAYRQVVASLYSPEACHYRALTGQVADSAAMAVGFVAMVEARASGIAYSRDPQAPARDTVLIHAVHGLGTTLADGGSWAEAVTVRNLCGERAELSRTTSSQELQVICEATSGVREERAAELPASCVGEDDATTLARWARALESHFGTPQDVEWVLDPAGRLCLLQSRPLQMAASESRPREALPGFEVLVDGGETACPGVGTGAAVHLAEDAELDLFPAGGVLVARRSSPRYVRVMDRAAAIVSDAGSLTGHMACLARELGVPTVLNLRRATTAILPGEVVTVDAGAGLVYRGEVPVKREEAGTAPGSRSAGQPPPETAASRLLKATAPLVIPLHLADPRQPDFAPSGCRTLHDIARFVHEKSYAEMFRQGEDLGDLRSASARLDVFLPVDLYVVDLGGALQPLPKGRKLRPEHVLSVPLKALLEGILDPRLPRFGPRPIDLGGLVSVMMRHALSSPEQDPTFRDPCYALASDLYLNYAVRVGYHFGVVDTFCSPTPSRNYISFRFAGGAADPRRRGRRARSIATVLRECSFTVSAAGDVVQARLTKAGQGETAGHLRTLGRLLQFYRQMDAAMTSDASADCFARAFLEGDFKLERLDVQGREVLPG